MSIAKHWCFTLNNYTPDELLRLSGLVDSGRIDYLCYGRETGENGTSHLQGHLYRKAKARLSWLKRHISDRAHWEVSQSYGKSIQYCKKGNQSKAEWDSFGCSGPNYGLGALVSEYGDPPALPGQRTDLESATSLVLNGVPMRDVASECPTVFVKFNRGLYALQSILTDSCEAPTCRGIWIFGKPGTGKSHSVRTFELELYIKPQNKWFDGYAGEEAMLLDDFDTNGKCLGHYIKIWADKWRCSGEIKGATVSLQHQRFYITSNYHPSEIWSDEGDAVLLEAIERRFFIVEKLNRLHDIDLSTISNNLRIVEDASSG